MKRIHHQHGATLIVGLIMLTLITLTVATAFSLSTTNLKSVGNMQFRNETIAAANLALEQIMSSPFSDDPAAEEIVVDLNNDGVTDYTVEIDEPDCIRATVIADTASAGRKSSAALKIPVAPDSYRTVWDITATVRDERTGASVRVHQGVRQILSEAQFNAVCT